MPNTNRLAQSRASSFVEQDSLARPADTTPYADGDAVSDSTTAPTILSWDLARIVGGGGVIMSAMLHKSAATLTAAAFDLYLFDAEPAAAGFKDNAQLAITDAEWADCIGGVSFASADGRSVVTGAIWDSSVLDKPFVAAPTVKTIYGVLVARDAYTPASGETLTVTLSGKQD